MAIYDTVNPYAADRQPRFYRLLAAESVAASIVDSWHAALTALRAAFAATGEELVSRGRLRFRPEAELTRSLLDAGFAVRRVYGDWDRRPARPTSPELIVAAR